MRKARNVKVGSVVEIPFYQFAPNRRGWNGWIFRLGIVEKIFIGAKTGRMCAKVKYIPHNPGRYEMFPVTYATKVVFLDNCFDPADTIKFQTDGMDRLEEVEKNGEKVCWAEDTALLIEAGVINYWKKEVT